MKFGCVEIKSNDWLLHYNLAKKKLYKNKLLPLQVNAKISYKNSWGCINKTSIRDKYYERIVQVTAVYKAGLGSS